MTVSRRTGLLAALSALGAGTLQGCSIPVGGTSPSPATPTTPDAVGSASASASTPVSPTAQGSPTPSPTAAAPALPWAGVADPLPAGPINVLIVGTDNNTMMGNTDVLVIAQLSADRTAVTLVGIPRDSLVTLASGGRGKINSALYRGGITNVKATVSNLFDGLTIHYVALTNFRDFIRICVLFNGFAVLNKITSSVTSKITGKVTRFPAGKLVVYAADWLIYARQRHGLPNGEFDRGERHRAIITGMTAGAKWLYTNNPNRLAAIAQGVFAHTAVYGGLTRDNVYGLLPHLVTIDLAKFTSLKAPHAAVADYVTLDQARLGALARALKAGDIGAYVKVYGG